MIITAVERGGWVYVYGEGNHELFRECGELNGYTSSSVSIKRNGYIYTYDTKHHVIASHPA